jgi:hypothetical protein
LEYCFVLKDLLDKNRDIFKKFLFFIIFENLIFEEIELKLKLNKQIKNNGNF